MPGAATLSSALDSKHWAKHSAEQTHVATAFQREPDEAQRNPMQAYKEALHSNRTTCALGPCTYSSQIAVLERANGCGAMCCPQRAGKPFNHTQCIYLVKQRAMAVLSAAAERVPVVSQVSTAQRIACADACRHSVLPWPVNSIALESRMMACASPSLRSCAQRVQERARNRRPQRVTFQLVTFLHFPCYGCGLPDALSSVTLQRTHVQPLQKRTHSFRRLARRDGLSWVGAQMRCG